MEKKCTKCKQSKPLGDFFKKSRTKDGLSFWCKMCWDDNRLLREGKDPEAVRAVRIVRAEVDYNIHVKERKRLRAAEYHKKNVGKPEYMAKQRKKANARLKIPQNHLSHRMSGQMYKALGKRKNNKHWEELVGYTISELMTHLESLFTEGMTWGNYGKWHVDHITPQVLFRYDTPGDIEFRMCWRLNNLQPLWAKDNLRKSNRLSPTG